MNDFMEEEVEVIQEPKQTLDISSGYHAYQDMGEAAFEVYVNGFYGMAITVPGVAGPFGGPLGTDLVIIVPSGDVKSFKTEEDELGLDTSE